MKINLSDAIEICRDIETKLIQIGYHCGLTGSCLHQGASEKDIDIIIYPHQISQELPLKDILSHIGATTMMHEKGQSSSVPSNLTPSTADKLVVVSEYQGYRVDFFFLT